MEPSSLRQRLRRHRAEVLAAAARRGASNVRVFGSLARGDDGSESDIDFLVDFEASRSLVDVAGLILDLQEILGVPVDVVEASTLRPGDEDVLADAVELESA
jgi:predicted nucleotidyltransferase